MATQANLAIGTTRVTEGSGPTGESAWAAVLARDAAADGRFVYAVRTTGVYCRPTCPSRRPARKNVEFFEAPAHAERAGFRACLRCRPREQASPARQAVERARAYLEAHADEKVTLGTLAREVGLSPHHLQRVFKRGTGLSPKDYATALRARRFKRQVRGGGSVTDALYGAGYSSGSRLYESADQHLGMTPGAYRTGGRGTRIRYTVVDSALGRLLVAATERGVCAVQLGDTDRSLAASLEREYPHAEIERDDPALAPAVSAILGHLRGGTRGLDLPVDVQGTAFEWQVWKALRGIPYGETRSYAEIAQAVGRPRAARAVARACASNRVALVVPCHRVVRSDGSAGGYRWGVGRKRRLLDQERRAAGGDEG